jgi:hypothetical protein
MAGSLRLPFSGQMGRKAGGFGDSFRRRQERGIRPLLKRIVLSGRALILHAREGGVRFGQRWCMRQTGAGPPALAPQLIALPHPTSQHTGGLPWICGSGLAHIRPRL